MGVFVWEYLQLLDGLKSIPMLAKQTCYFAYFTMD